MTQLVSTCDDLWWIVLTCNDLWQLVTTCDDLQRLLTVCENLRWLVTTFDDLWQLVTICDNWWQQWQLVKLERWRRYWTNGKILKSVSDRQKTDEVTDKTTIREPRVSKQGLRRTRELRQCTNWKVNLQICQLVRICELVRLADPSSWSV